MSDNELKGLIAKYMKIRVRSHSDVMKGTGISRSTYYRKISNPEEYSLGELRSIFNYLKIPKEERNIL